MRPVVVYPGSFDPPTRGHLAIAVQAANVFPHLYIICSSNPEKTGRWFTPDQAKELWSAYELPANCTVMTLAEFLNERKEKKGDMIMVRGIRNQADLQYEFKITLENHRNYGISRYFYILSDGPLCRVSSTVVRRMAEKLEIEKLHKLVAPLVISTLLEKVLDIGSLFMAVGKPGSGKSTILRELARCDEHIGHIDTDEFNRELRPLLIEHFGDEDLEKLAIANEKSLKAVIAKPWFELLKQRLEAARGKTNVIVEVPFGLAADKAVYRFLGGRIIYFGCQRKRTNRQRVLDRGTPDILPFIDRIPGWAGSKQVCRAERLNLYRVKTDGNREKLPDRVTKMKERLKGEGSCRTYSRELCWDI